MTKNNVPPRVIKNAALYIRVSTDRQAREGDSLREQKDSLEAYAQRKGYAVYGVYIDDGISGQKLQARDELTRLLADVKADNIDVILFTKLDRWFRNARHYLNIQAFLDDHGVSWTAIREEYYDTTTPMGKMMVNMSMNFAELEAQMAGERIAAVFANKAANGEVTSGSIPFGYKIESKHLVPSDDAKWVKYAFDWFERTPNIKRLCLHMQEKGICKTTTAWRGMLLQKKYIGYYRGNDHYCEPIISVDQFEAVQRMLGHAKHNKKYEYIFTGLMRCGECGHSLAGFTKRYRYMLDSGEMADKRYQAHKCYIHWTYHTCSNSKYRLEGGIEKSLLSTLKDDLKRHIEIDAETVKAHADSKAAIERIERRLDRLKALYLDGDMSLLDYKKEKAIMAEEIQRLQAEATEPPKDHSAIEALIKTPDLIGLYKKLDVPGKAYFWRQIIDHIDLNSDGSITPYFL